ncbi:MAG TPA: acyl-CoA dehydratase activase-related protein [Bacillota bacterium]
MKIGLPNTLFAAYHLPYWHKILTLLQLEIVNAGPSNQKTAAAGSRLLPPEFCLPVKVFLGQILSLMEQKVDLILLPRMTSRCNTNFFCPKLLGLPDIVKYTVGLDERYWLAPKISCNGLQIRLEQPPQQKLTAPWQFKQIEDRANRYWQTVLQCCREEKLTLGAFTQRLKLTASGSGLTIGLLGYAYTLYDPFISKGVLSKLSGLGVTIRTWEMMEPDLIEQNLKTLKRPLYWNFGRIVLGAGFCFLKDPEIDGLIYVSTFGCGPDSVATKLLSIAAGQLEKPLLLVNLDEHTEGGHLQTRLEAFVDLLATRKEKMGISGSRWAGGL